MDQKNTIVKCKAHPDCLFNHNGICDNYMINIGVDGKCESYIETATCQDCEFYDNACDVSFLKEDLEKIQQTLKQDSIPCVMKIAEFNKSNKNKSVINDWNYAATPDICKTCKKVVYGRPCKWKNVVYGVWTCYEEEKNEI